MKPRTEHPQKSRLDGWLLYSSPPRRPHEALIDAGLVHQLESGAWTLTTTGREAEIKELRYKLVTFTRARAFLWTAVAGCRAIPSPPPSPTSGRRGRWFESSYPDHPILKQ